MGKRQFDECSVIETGAQSFESRFGIKRRRHDSDDLPSICPWRCNLTGLSQQHNLYFVAHSGDIYVYEPRFPSQQLSKEPALVVRSTASLADLQGYLDRDQPHSINNLVVQCLGNEEVVAAVRDDGDVDAFMVRHILQAIDRRNDPENRLSNFGDEIRPMFQSNVGISAWGLAIHTQARMIAVSSNAHEVRVFAFALVEAGDGEGTDSDEGDENYQATDSYEQDQAMLNKPIASHRKTNETRITMNGEANIPYISFCNTGDDPTARWLVTTDISGYTRILDVEKMRMIQGIRFGPALVSHPAGDYYDRLNAGWLALFLDSRSFKVEDEPEKAVGMHQDEFIKCLEGDQSNWDLSKTVKQVAQTNERFTKPKRPSEKPHNPQVRVARSETSHSRSASSEGSVSLPSDTNMDADVDEDEDEDGQAASDEVVDFLSDADEEDEGTEDYIAPSQYYSGTSITGFTTTFARPTNLCEDLPCPIIHASIRNIYLLQPSSQSHVKGPFCSPMIGLANPLHQAIAGDYSFLNMFDRLNLHAYIPQLGIIIVASQKGRAAILALTSIPSNAVYPGSKQPNVHSRRPTYAFRMEHILPFARQEAVGHRPFAPLHGIAVGPVQGTEHLPDETKRWRLMMMYQDHSVLSYEIGRRSQRDSVQQLIV